jgi:uncharacterized protein (TIGR02466 family)
MEFKVFEKICWPTLLWECPVIGIDNTSIKKYCLEVKSQKQGIVISNKGGWHSQELIFPILKELETLLSNLTLFVNDVTALHTGIHNLTLGNWWININNKHDYNGIHDHQNSILSGVYYVSVPQSNMGNLILHRGDNAEYFLNSRVKMKPTSFNKISLECPIKESMFYLFPSWIKHSVERNESDQERISIAFNFISPDQ